MTQEIYVNLPVKDLNRSIKFFSSLGYTFNPEFSNENATCMIISEHIFVMLLVEPFFQTFTQKTIVDAHKAVESIICLSAESHAEIDAMVAKAVAAGATTPSPSQDHGFMYQHSYQDLDGHHWELVYMHGKPGEPLNKSGAVIAP